MSPDHSLEEYFNDCYKTVFYSVNSENPTLILMGLAQFELINQICRKYNIKTKASKTAMYRRVITAYPEMRHWFKITVPDEYKNALQNRSKVVS